MPGQTPRTSANPRRLPIANKGRPKAEVVEDTPAPQGDLKETPVIPASLKPINNKGSVEGRNRWTEICRILITREVLTSECLPAVENLCRCYMRLSHIETIIGRDGEVLRNPKTKQPTKQHPLLKERSTMLTLIRAHLCDFRLNPSTVRSSLGQPKGAGRGIVSRDQDDDDFDEA